MKPLLCLGDAVIDFIPLNANREYMMRAAGAPLNVAAMVVKIGGDAYFSGMVGADSFGQVIIDTAEQLGVNAKHIKATSEAITTLVFVHLNHQGDRSFEFVRKPGADGFLSVNDVPLEQIENSGALHIGSVSLSMPLSAEATHYAVDYGKKRAIPISFDPNYRADVWPNEYAGRKAILEMLPKCDLLKVSEEEVWYLAETTDTMLGIERLKLYDTPFTVITKGAQGALCLYNNRLWEIDAYAAQSIDTTGAGDSFWGTLLYELLQDETNWRKKTDEQICAALKRASAAAALVIGRKGTLGMQPSLTEIEELIRSQPNLRCICI